MDEARHEAEGPAAEPHQRRDAQRVRCLLLSPPGVDPPAELLGALRKRDVEIERPATVYDALADALTTSENGAPLTVVVVDPVRWPDGQADRLAAALERYAPRVARWRYEAASRPRLRGFNAPSPSVVVTPAAKAHANGSPRRPAEPPPLRLTGLDELPADPPHAPTDAAPLEVESEERDERPSDLLSGEELDMLLADDDEDFDDTEDRR